MKRDSKKGIFDWRDFNLANLVRKKGKLRISVIIPTRNESVTIGQIVKDIRKELMEDYKLVDELIVLDGCSTDDTKAKARHAGAKVIKDVDIASQLGNFCGKGNALYKSYFACTGDIMAFIDGDIRNFTTRFVIGIVGPLILNKKISFVKAFYDRPLLVGGKYKSGAGGRVTEILARPLINTFFPSLADIRQPLAGEYAIRKNLFRKIQIPSGYGVEIATLIEVLHIEGRQAIAQVDLGERRHFNQNIRALGKMGFEVLHSFLHYAMKFEKVYAKRIFSDYYDIKNDSVYSISQKYYKPICDMYARSEIIFLRHGQTDWNKEKRIQSRSDTALNATGRKQALKVASLLKKEKICAIYSSPLVRAVETAAAIASKHGLPVRIDERLLEIDHGTWSGKKETHLMEKYPERYKKWKKEPWKYLPPRAESWQKLKMRLSSFLKEIKPKHSGEKILVVTHRGALASALTVVNNKPFKYINKYLPDNCKPIRVKL